MIISFHVYNIFFLYLYITFFNKNRRLFQEAHIRSRIKLHACVNACVKFVGIATLTGILMNARV